MADIPPPPLDPFPGIPTPRPATGPARRPGVLTGAAAILMFAGALAVFFGTIGMTGGRADVDAPFFDSEATRSIAAFVLVVHGALSVLAGWLILRLRPAGRTLGIVLVSVGIVAGLAQLRNSGSSGFLTIALDAFILYVLVAYGFLFRQPPNAR